MIARLVPEDPVAELSLESGGVPRVLRCHYQVTGLQCQLPKGLGCLLEIGCKQVGESFLWGSVLTRKHITLIANKRRPV